MQQQNPFELLPLELKMPGQESRCHHWQGGKRRHQQIVVSRLRQFLSPSPSIGKAKGHSRKEQRHREVHQHHVLRVLCQQHRSGVNGFRDAGHCTTALPERCCWQSTRSTWCWCTSRLRCSLREWPLAGQIDGRGERHWRRRLTTIC